MSAWFGVCLIVSYTIQTNIIYVSSYLYPYESESRETKSLNGLWDFKISPEGNTDIGFLQAWYLKSFDELGDYIKMPVPASFNDITTNKTIRDYVGWVWYQRSFYIPKRWLNNDIRVSLHFGSVHYFAVVFINGYKAREHEGGHLPFHIELPAEHLTRYNLVTVAVNNTLNPNTIAQGQVTFKNLSLSYPSGYRQYSHDFDYFDYAGINRPVTLYTTPKKIYVKDIKVITDIHKEIGIVKFNVTPSSYQISKFSIKCQVELFDKTGMIVAQSSLCNGTLMIHNAHYWWPIRTCKKTPGYLYSMKVTLEAEGSDPDVYSLPVGIRTINKTATSILINNKLIYLQGFGMHEDSNIRGRGFDYAVMTRDLNLIRWIGANSFRTSHYPYAEETLNEADASGILVIVEAPACSLKGFGPELYKRHVAYLQEMMDIHKNRPSVIMWSLANEPVSNNETADYYFGNLTFEAKQIDQTRLVTVVGSQPIENEKVAKHVDVVCLNRYKGWYSDSGHTDLIVYQVTEEMKAWHKKYNKPILITEYGAGSISGLHTLPNSMWSEDYQVLYHQLHFEAFDRLRQEGSLAGEMMWNFIDFNTPQEYFRPGRCSKGLFTRERQPKAAAYTVQERYLTLANCTLNL